jgi:hypothetical protein
MPCSASSPRGFQTEATAAVRDAQRLGTTRGTRGVSPLPARPPLAASGIGVCHVILDTGWIARSEIMCISDSPPWVWPPLPQAAAARVTRTSFRTYPEPKPRAASSAAPCAERR